jgi:hypothetical protein
MYVPLSSRCVSACSSCLITVQQMWRLLRKTDASSPQREGPISKYIRSWNEYNLSHGSRRRVEKNNCAGEDQQEFTGLAPTWLTWRSLVSLFGGWAETEATWSAITGSIVPTPEDRWVSRIWWNEKWEEKLKYSEKTCSKATWSTTNLTGFELGSNPDSCGRKPATNHLSYGTA